MTEFRDEGRNDYCAVSVDTTAQFLSPSQVASSQFSGQTMPASNMPVSTIVSTTATLGANSVMSIHVENKSSEPQATTLRVEVCEGNRMRQISVSTTCGMSSQTTPITQSTITDFLSRPHFKVPHTGPATVCQRSALFHSSTSEMHTNDLKPVLDPVVREGKTIITLIVDGGPDWSTGSLLNAVYFRRLWKVCNLDMLCITSFAARYSAYNPIEHLWSILSKKLACVRLSAIADGDNKAPYYISGISDEEKKSKRSFSL